MPDQVEELRAEAFDALREALLDNIGDQLAAVLQTYGDAVRGMSRRTSALRRERNVLAWLHAEAAWQRDAFGDTLANLRDDEVDDLTAAVLARLTLDASGYIPWGRLRRTEAELDALRRATVRAMHTALSCCHPLTGDCDDKAVNQLMQQEGITGPCVTDGTAENPRTTGPGAGPATTTSPNQTWPATTGSATAPTTPSSSHPTDGKPRKACPECSAQPWRPHREDCQLLLHEQEMRDIAAPVEPPRVETITVTVRDRSAEAPWGSGPISPVIRKVTISANCPECGGLRGEPTGLNSCDDGAYYWVQVWKNPCGHVDLYESVIEEAAELAAAAAVGQSGGGA